MDMDRIIIQAIDDSVLRAYFAAHAPAEPWPEFEPIMPPKPIPPIREPVGNNGEAPTDDELKSLKEGRSSIADQEKAHPKFTYWIRAWHEYQREMIEYDTRYFRERRAQWPWYYADQVLARRLTGKAETCAA